MKRIAADELRHAELAWSVARWLDRRLDPSARTRVRQARIRAVESLVRSAELPADPEVVSELGFPTPDEARALVSNLSSTLWNAA
jgi:hypothetical protein